MNIRLPNITAQTDAGKLEQMRSYMYQLVDQLNWALGTLDSAQSAQTEQTLVVDESISEEEAQDTFNSIKALIIKSADIVKAYEQTITENFNGKYFADSDFGTYIEETRASIEKNSQGITENYQNIQTISTEYGQLQEESRITNAYIRRGLLGYDDDGSAIYGVEVGETDADGNFVKCARFKSDRLSFYDAMGSEVAYIGAGCLYVRGKTVFLGEIQLGGYSTDTSDGLAFTWIGG